MVVLALKILPAVLATVALLPEIMKVEPEALASTTPPPAVLTKELEPPLVSVNVTFVPNISCSLLVLLNNSLKELRLLPRVISPFVTEKPPMVGVVVGLK